MEGHKKGRLIVGAVVAFVVSFLWSFPVRENLEAVAAKALTSLGHCRVSFNGLHIAYFPPGLQLEGLQAKGPCLGPSFKLPPLSQASLSFGGVSLSPLGVKVSLRARGEDLAIVAHASVGPWGQRVRIEDSQVSLEAMGTAMGQSWPLRGILNVNALVGLEDQFPQQLKLRVSSSRPSFTMLPDTVLGPLFMRAEMADGEELKVVQFELGDHLADLSVRASGVVQLNRANLGASQGDLKAKVRLGESLENHFLIKTFLKKARFKDGLYEFDLNGPLHWAL